MKQKHKTLAAELEAARVRLACAIESRDGQAGMIVTLSEHLQMSARGLVDDNWLEGLHRLGGFPEFDGEDDAPEFAVDDAGHYHPMICEHLRATALELFAEVAELDSAREAEAARVAYLEAAIAGDISSLPGFGNVAADRAAAAADAQGEALTAELLRPAASISARTGTIETYSPLFRDSAANPQLNLF